MMLSIPVVAVDERHARPTRFARLIAFCYWAGGVLAGALAVTGCGAGPAHAPKTWSRPEIVVAPSNFSGVHGLAIDSKGRLLAGTILGNAIWEVDRTSGVAKVFIGGPEGQADDIAVGPRGELAWTNMLSGVLRYRVDDTAPIRVLAKDLPGLNSLDFDRRNGKLFVSQCEAGDALWEIDTSAIRTPRLIAKDMGGLNGFEVGADGMIYGPIMSKRQVVRIDPSNGATTVINTEFQMPAAVNLDGKGNLWVVDATAGELCRIDIATGRKTLVKHLKTALDNLAVAPDGVVYVSNMADNSIEAFDPRTGELRLLTSGKLALPSGLKWDGGSLWVADVFAFRKVELGSGYVRDIARIYASDLEAPVALGLSSRYIVLSSWYSGTVHVIDRATLKTNAMLREWNLPYDAVPLPDGSILVLELSTGSLTKVDGPDFKVRHRVASGLADPVQMIVSHNGAVYVTEARGNLTRVNLADGSKSRVTSGLLLPEGVTETPWSTFIIAEAAAARLSEFDPISRRSRTVAKELPIGLARSPGMPEPYVPTGLAVASDGTVYFSANRNDAIYKVRPLW